PSSGLVNVSSNIDVNATEQPEGDATTKGVSVGALKVGGTDTTTTVDPIVTAYIGGGTVRAGTGNTNNISVVAIVLPDSGSAPSYNVDSVDTAKDTLQVANHGLSTGDTILLSGREYNVISAGDNDISLGATFGGPNVDPTRDLITFDTPHHFLDGDTVIYKTGTTGIPGLTDGNTYTVVVVDGTHIKLRDPALSYSLTTFQPVISGGNTIDLTGHGFVDGDAVTYFAPDTKKTFSSKQVDVDANDTKSTVDENNNPITVASPANADNNNIQFVDDEGRSVSSGFSVGNLVRYNSTGSAIGGLQVGQDYKVVSVGGPNNSAVQLGATSTVSVTFHNNGGSPGTITRS